MRKKYEQIFGRRLTAAGTYYSKYILKNKCKPRDHIIQIMKIIDISLLNTILILDDNHSSYQELPVKFYNSFDAHHVSNSIDENRTNNFPCIRNIR